MPAATPLPRGPSVLTLYSAADLLTAAGCPVCRYAVEASDRYLGWFALEGHAQPATITRLCDGLGMCAWHTRRLMSQPGAAVRLTAVYRYVTAAARDRLAGSPRRLMACPGCEHDDAAARRALETLIEGLADSAVRHRCRDLGGLCLPHLDAAAAAGGRVPLTWLAETMRERLAEHDDRCDWLAGTDRDAETRRVLRNALPPPRSPAPSTCRVCLAGAHAEREALERLPGLVSDGPDPAVMLCAGHLADAAAATGAAASLRRLLAWQAECRTSRLQRKPGRWMHASLRRDPVGRCEVCHARADAAQHALTNVSEIATATGEPTLCVRHHVLLRTVNARASREVASAAAAHASELTGELEAAFERIVRARRDRLAEPESDAWRRAAAFLDGSVFGGCPVPASAAGRWASPGN